MVWLLVAHGGCGNWSDDLDLFKAKELREALTRGADTLRNGGVVDAVEAVVTYLEDSEFFNAGTGSSLNLMGYAEMDAAIMDGRTLKAGAVAQIRTIKNPVKLARMVMESDRHVFYAGWEIERRGILNGLAVTDPVTKHAKQRWLQQVNRLTEESGSNPSYSHLETVGAIAIDDDGNVAAATSTGGLPLKMPGRIGDTPIIGAGIYADNFSGGVLTTGVGEIAIRLGTARRVCADMEAGFSPQEAVNRHLEFAKKRLGDVVLGIVAVDKGYNVGYAYTTPKMVVGFLRSDSGSPQLLR